MNDVAEPAPEAAMIAAIQPLRSLAPADRVAAPPLRRRMDERRECLARWRPDSVNDDWSLVLYARPADPTDVQSPVARMALHLPSGNGESAVFWEDADPEFRAWVEANLPSIAGEIAASQPQELLAVRQRAGLSTNLAQKLGELMPHLVVLGGMLAFAYMFGIVHIN